MCDDLIFMYPFSFIVIGHSGSGETSFCICFLPKINALCTEREIDGCIIWYYNEKTAVPSHHYLPAKIIYNKGVP